MAIVESESVQIEELGELTVLTVNRPESLNALNQDVLQSLLLAFEKIGKNQNLRTVIITGKGEKAFVAGADIRSMYDLGPRAIAEYLELGQRTMRVIETFPVPVIAAVNGFALGGGLELALACDLIFAVKSTKIGQPEVNLGIIPGFGGTQRLIQRAGIGTTRRLVYSGEFVSAEEGYTLGIVDKLFDQEGFLDEVKKYASLIASKGPLAVRASKEVIRRSQEALLLSGLRYEVEGFLSVFDSKDREEGMAAFLEKRAANFTGR